MTRALMVLFILMTSTAQASMPDLYASNDWQPLVVGLGTLSFMCALFRFLVRLMGGSKRDAGNDKGSS